MSETKEIVYRRAEKRDLSAVVDLCMQVEEQHEAYWPLRWERRGGLAEGYLGWLSRRLEEPRMLILVAAEGEAVAGMVIVTMRRRCRSIRTASMRMCRTWR